MIESEREDSMSKKNGEKARAAIEKRRRNAQRVKDRARRDELKQSPAATATKKR